MSQEQIGVTLLVIDALDRLGIPYLLGGSVASSIYGEPRATRDTDIVADVRVEHVGSLCGMLEKDFYIAEGAITDSINHQSSFNLIHYETLFKVDIFIPKHRSFERQEFQRRILQVVAKEPERKAYVASAEDVILAKLEWYRQGNEVSDQQWRDIVGIFKANKERLDERYMAQFATELGVIDLLQRLIAIE